MSGRHRPPPPPARTARRIAGAGPPPWRRVPRGVVLGRHLSNIFAKLGVSSRTEAAAAV